MGRSLVLSFLIISVVFYTASRPTDRSSGKIDYISAVKNHDFSARSAEKRFFNTLRSQPTIPKKQVAQQKPLIFPSNNLLISPTSQPNKVTMALPYARPQYKTSQAKHQIASAAALTHNKKKEKFGLSALPSYLPLNNIAERTAAQKKRQEKNKLAQNKKNNVKVARIHPKELENELMDFQPIEHVYTPPQKDVMAATPSATEKTEANVATTRPNTKENIKTARLPKRPLKTELLVKVQKKEASTLLTALPVKRAPFFKVSPLLKKETIKVATIALPVKAFRAAIKAEQSIQATNPVTIASYTKKERVKAPKNARTIKQTARSRRLRTLRAASSKRVRARNYALKRKRMKALLRKTELRLRRKRSIAQRKSKPSALRTKHASKRDRQKRRLDTRFRKRNRLTAQNTRKVQQRLQRQRKKAQRFARLARQSGSNSRRRISRGAIRKSSNKRLTKLKADRKSKKTVTNKLKVQRKKAQRLARKANKTRRRKVTRLRLSALKVKPKAAVRKKISRRNKKYFKRRVGTKNKRLKLKLRAKNKTILRRIDKKLKRKNLKIRKLAALKQRKKTRTKRNNRTNKKKKRVKRKKFTKPKIRTQSKKRKIARKSKRKRTRVARRRIAKKVFRFSMDGSID